MYTCAFLFVQRWKWFIPSFIPYFDILSFKFFTSLLFFLEYHKLAKDDYIKIIMKLWKQTKQKIVTSGSSKISNINGTIYVALMWIDNGMYIILENVAERLLNVKLFFVLLRYSETSLQRILTSPTYLDIVEGRSSLSLQFF